MAEAGRHFTKKEIVSQLTANSTTENVNIAVKFILSELTIDAHNIDEEALNKLKSSLKGFVSNVDQRWNKACRSKERFESQNSVWLESMFGLPIGLVNTNTPPLVDEVVKAGPSSGRPPLKFSEMSFRSKRRHASGLKDEDHDAEKLVMAGTMAARAEHKLDLARILKEAMKSPGRPAKMRRTLFQPVPQLSKYTADEALAMLYDCGLSKFQYMRLRTGAKAKGAEIYPPYEVLLDAKKRALPDPLSIDISDNGEVAETYLQDLLNHTAKRIIELNCDVIQEYMSRIISSSLDVDFILIWGLDAATGQSIYAQKKAPNLASLLAVSTVPLRLVHQSEILWINRTPQSYRYCRPIKLAFIKETAEVIKEEVGNIKYQIERLHPFQLKLSVNQAVNVTFHLYLTMIDGKVLNHITGTSSMQVCPICKATPLQFNKLQNFQLGIFSPETNTLQFGVSPLHCWIRFMECCLHIAYRLDFKKWQAKGNVNKQMFNDRKEMVKYRLEDELGLKVDRVRPGGAGTSNNGNTARKAFTNYEKFSEILGLEEELLKNLRIILICLSCLLPIDPDKFGDFCYQTAELYVKHYSWYYMPASLHKILIHGSQILLHSVLPVGVMSEEAGESRHKFFKQDREFHSRKISPKDTMRDVYHRALATSDPILASFSLESRLNRKKRLILPSEVIQMLLIPTEPAQAELHGTSSESSDEEGEQEDDTGLVNFFIQLGNLNLDSDDVCQG